MAQTFDIRFARTAGLAALLEVPENAFRWKGGGRLHIDAHGISIGLKRGLAAARLWRDFLTTYADGLRTRDHQKMASAFDELARAQEMQSRARLYLR